MKSVKIRINAASKDLTFSSYRKLEDDGSNFTKWFSYEFFCYPAGKNESGGRKTKQSKAYTGT
ncbi:hypothetical protein B9J77_04045 [candidate division NPL-UPA2 bacterium Unc8]|uniref:Uncharacterized protein n=1 Tax=candidate division NPL-UPA2 bacterium Unc8 TaxID=1980939 RepID=A0A399FXP2_UNCN2|nr:MAG: hypothetical protein B9J77_04045 [candidate division NPL-UPA2 bacterium Unc8]